MHGHMVPLHAWYRCWLVFGSHVHVEHYNRSDGGCYTNNSICHSKNNAVAGLEKPLLKGDGTIRTGLSGVRGLWPLSKP